MTETFVIHLERSTARQRNVDKLLAASPYPARVWPACDGAAMESHVRDNLVSDKPLFTPAYPFDLSMGEIGCFESHRSVWRYMVENDVPAALILEDDVAIEDASFEAALSLCETHIETFGYIQLQVRTVADGVCVAKHPNNTCLVRPKIVPLRTSAQMVSLGAARALLDACEQIDRPVDGFLQLFWETNVRPHCVVPSGVADLTQASGGSTVSRKRTLSQKLKAAIARQMYRRHIKALSDRHDQLAESS